MAKKKKSAETKSYLPPTSPVAIQPGDTGFKLIGSAYNRWMGLFKDWQKAKPRIMNPDTNWDMNAKPMTKAQRKKKRKTLYLKESQKIPGGLADGMDIDDIASKHRIISDKDKLELNLEFERGTKEEMEHTSDESIAKEIALDHLFEDPKYYSKLASVEGKDSNETESFGENNTSIKKREGAVSEKGPSGIPIVKEPKGKSTKVWVKPGSAKIYPYLDVDAKQKKKGKKNLENLKDYRDWLIKEDAKYKPETEYKEDTRRQINLDLIRKTKEYENLLALGFKENTSHQQELNNTMKFERSKNKQTEAGHSNVFYTLHPTGVVRRYNPEKGKDTPEGSGNVIKKFNTAFSSPKEYKKGLRYLWQYLRRKENRGDFR